MFMYTSPGIISGVGISNSPGDMHEWFPWPKVCQHLSQITYNYSHVSRSLLDNDLKSWKFLRLVERVTSCEKTQSGAVVLRDWVLYTVKTCGGLIVSYACFLHVPLCSLVRILWEVHQNMCQWSWNIPPKPVHSTEVLCQRQHSYLVSQRWYYVIA